MAGASLGTKFLIGTFSVADLTSIGGIDISADTIDVSTRRRWLATVYHRHERCGGSGSKWVL